MLNQESMTFAQRRIEDFYAVQKEASLPEKIEAVNTLLEGLGLDDDLKASFVDWLQEFAGPDHEGAAMLGLLVGLFAYQHNQM